MKLYTTYIVQNWMAESLRWKRQEDPENVHQRPENIWGDTEVLLLVHKEAEAEGITEAIMDDLVTEDLDILDLELELEGDMEVLLKAIQFTEVEVLTHTVVLLVDMGEDTILTRGGQEKEVHLITTEEILPTMKERHLRIMKEEAQGHLHLMIDDKVDKL